MRCDPWESCLRLVQGSDGRLVTGTWKNRGFNSALYKSRITRLDAETKSVLEEANYGIWSNFATSIAEAALSMVMLRLLSMCSELLRHVHWDSRQRFRGSRPLSLVVLWKFSSR